MNELKYQDAIAGTYILENEQEVLLIDVSKLDSPIQESMKEIGNNLEAYKEYGRTKKLSKYI